MRHQLLCTCLYTNLKRIFFLQLLFLFACTASGQSLVNSTGSTVNSNNFTIEYAVGEIAITTLSSNNNHTTQGLLQPIIQIGIDPCKTLDFIPSAFTPNNDGLNDCYGVTHWLPTSTFELAIYDRWGEMIFRTTDQYACWDGKYRNKDQPIGVYVYMIRANTNCGPAFKKGTFVLVR